MTAAKAAKSAGLKNLAEVAKLTGVDRQTLHNWSKDKPLLFNIVLKGCVAEIDRLPSPLEEST
jgi:hypothetical protein